MEIAGRRKTHSLAVYVLDQDPLNRFYGTVDPELLFRNIGETAVINFEAPSVLDQHLQVSYILMRYFGSQANKRLVRRLGAAD